MAYNAITDTEITVGKPSKRSLWLKIKDNFDYFFGLSNPGGLVNGSFELDTDSDGIPDNWTRSLYPGGSGGFETASPEHGGQSYYFTHPGGAGNGGGLLESSYVGISELKQHSLGFIMRSSIVGMRNIVQLHYYDKGKVYLSYVNLYDGTAASTSAEHHSYNFTPPANARFYKVRLVGGYTDTDFAGTTYFDNVSQSYYHDGAINIAKLYPASYTAGNNLKHANDGTGTVTSASYVKKLEITIQKGGVFRIKFDIRNQAGGGDCQGRIYKNGVAYGTEQTVSGATWITKSEDLSGFAVGDTIELWCKRNSFTGEYRNLRLYAAEHEVEFLTTL